MVIIDPVRANRPVLERSDLGFLAYPDAQPFSDRAASGYQLTLERLRVWAIGVQEYLVDSGAVFDTNVDLLLTAIEASLAQQSANVTGQLVATLAALGRDVPWQALGIFADGITNDGPALQAALSALTVPARIELPPGRTVNLGTSALEVNASKVSFVGMNTILLGGTIHVFSSVDYYSNHLNWHTLFDSVVFRGSTITIGGDLATQPTQGKFRFVDGGMIGGSLNFEIHAWKLAFLHFHLQGTKVNALAGATAQDRGENMIFRDCMIGDGSDINLRQNGDWHFDGCSLDNMPITISGNAHAFFANCHFEMKAGDNNTRGFLQVLDGFSIASIRDCELVINGNGSNNYERSPFYVDAAVVGGGIIIDGLAIPSQPYVNPEIGDGYRLLVGGKGPAHVRNIFSYANAWQYGMALCSRENRIYNGDAEIGTSAGWVLPNNGWTLDQTFKHKDASSHKIQAAAGTGVTMYQEFPVTAGRGLWGQMWQSFNAANGSNLGTQIDYYNQAGDKISTARYDLQTVAATRFWRTWDLVPVGVVKARLSFYLNNAVNASGANATMNIDSVIINID